MRILLLACAVPLLGACVESNLGGVGCDPPCPSGESCEAGSCVPAEAGYCGDSRLQLQLGEECDSGNPPPQEGPCRADCRFRCGDGILDAGESCDPEDLSDPERARCTASCTRSAPALCGNGVRDPGEDCDPADPGDPARDRCTATCALPAYCGDAVVDPGESCDKGEWNGSPGHGCSLTCTSVGCPGPGSPACDLPLVSLSAGVYHTLVLDSAGGLWGFGRGDRGELGRGEDLDDHLEAVAVQAPGDVTFRATGTGWSDSFGITTGGALLGWGKNESGSLGDAGGLPNVIVPVPTDLVPGRHFVAVAGGNCHTVAIEEGTGALWSWGCNTAGQLGDGSLTARLTPQQVDPGPFQAVATGDTHTLALLQSGGVVVFGNNNRRALGRAGDDARLPEPLAFDPGGPVVAIAAGRDNGFALTADHRLFQWGAHPEDADQTARQAPAEVLLPGAGPIVKIRTTSDLAVAIDEDGFAFTWGQNNHGECGRGLLSTETMRCEPGRIEGIPRVLDAVAGDNHLVLLTEEGLYSAGSNGFQQVGRGCAEEELASVAPICPL